MIFMIYMLSHILPHILPILPLPLPPSAGLADQRHFNVVIVANSMKISAIHGYSHMKSTRKGSWIE